eukprot:356188-Chlamydomonas_euryale.AAC.15
MPRKKVCSGLVSNVRKEGPSRPLGLGGPCATAPPAAACMVPSDARKQYTPPLVETKFWNRRQLLPDTRWHHRC